ncbi:hypothetical protein JAO73_02245 [Hymenobacter sp. BT523]|uniref:beta strand repeat-containing protein n=1 Tax=Hymenobacter sp. BT523 TaxID=2795725 RepID=UPI0018EDFCEC|nr:hypothetical protein [Hymenobacter sp. BT523]MBJ6107814.1 hypothetical protein [Hymenobacter sp. BT523]
MLHSLLSLSRTVVRRIAQRMPVLAWAVLAGATGSQTAWAQQTGIFQTTVRIDGFDRAGNLNAGNTTPYEGATLGAGGYSPGNASLVLDGAEVRTFKNNGGNVTAATLFYRVYLLGSTTRGSASPAYTAVNLPFGANLGSCDNNGCDQRWTLTGANINLTAGLTTRGTYVVEVYWRASTNLGDRFDSNGGSNFVATFGFAGSPLCGTYTLNNSLAASADNFTSFATAFNSLNTAGVSCATTFNVRDNLTYPESNVQLNAVAGAGATARVTFQRDNSTASGANVRPVVKPAANAGGGAQDAIIKLSGADFITFDGIDVSDANSTAGTNTQKMEYGYALFRPSATDGCQNNVIRNCAVTLNKTNSGTIGIYSANANISGVAQVTSDVAGANSGNEFDGNTITNACLGISLLGRATAGAFPDLNNKVGSTLGNALSDISGTTTATVFGIKADYQSGLRIENNVISIPNGNSSAPIRGIATGFTSSAGMLGTLLISGNTVSITSASTGSVVGILQNAGGAVGNVSITNNRVQNSVLTGATGAVSWLVDASSNGTTPQTVTITGNFITGNSSVTTDEVNHILRSGVNSAATTISANQVANNVSGDASAVNYIADRTNNTATTVVISGNQVSNNSAASFGNVIGISRASVGATAASASTSISSNQVANNTKSGNGAFYGIYVANAAAGATPITLSSNTVSGNQATGAIGRLVGAAVNTGTLTFSSNTIINNAVPNATGTGSSGSLVAGYSQEASGAVPSETLTDNVITGLSIGGTGTTAEHNVWGIYIGGGSAGTAQSILRNVVGGLSIGGSGSGNVVGIYLSAVNTTSGSSSVARNKLYDLSATGAAGKVTGIYQLFGGTVTYANNLLGDFRTPAGAGRSAVTGLNLTGGAAANVYFTTVYLNASSTGPNFGTSGIVLGATAPLVNLRNNVVANLSTPNGTFVTAALRRDDVNATNSNFASTTNNNLYWAGTPSPTSVLFTDGTVTAQDLPAYKLLLAPKEADSFTENPPFVSTDGTTANFLHIKLNYGTQIESGGQPIAGFTDDFDGDARNATKPDLGADEGAFRLGPPLPVELSAFEARRQGDDATLAWATASEKNNRGFEVQVSTNGHTFRPLAFVAGAGSSTAPRRYDYLDREAGKAGRRYYRLRQLDFDGAASFSPVRTLDFGSVASLDALQAAPQPFNNELFLTVHSLQAEAGVLFTLTDATGRRALTQRLDVPAGTSQLPLRDLSAVPVGLYLLQTTLAGQPLRLKVIKR